MTLHDPRRFLYREALDPDEAKRLAARHLGGCDDGELYLQYRTSEAFGFDDGRLKTASYDTNAGFGLRAVSGEMTAFAHANELSEAAIRRAGASGRRARAARAPPRRSTQPRSRSPARPGRRAGRSTAREEAGSPGSRTPAR